MDADRLRNILEAALLAAGRPLTLDVLLALFQPQGVTVSGEDEGEPALPEGMPGRAEVKAALEALAADYSQRGLELKEVASGYRVQVRQDYAETLRPLWTERPSRYSRALLETLALIAYRQPITRGEIEDIRGVSVSSSIVKTMLEREWVRVVGHRDVPGKPAMYGTTRQFLDHFNLQSLADLPTLAEIRDIDQITGELFPEHTGGSAEPVASAAAPEFDEQGPDLPEPVEPLPLDQPLVEPKPLEPSVAPPEMDADESKRPHV